jgi:hypothetical protein
LTEEEIKIVGRTKRQGNQDISIATKKHCAFFLLNAIAVYDLLQFSIVDRSARLLLRIVEDLL